MVFLNQSGFFGFHERTRTSFLKWIRIQHGSSRSATLWPLDKAVLRNGSLPADVIAWMPFHSIDLTSVVPSPRSRFPGSGSDFSTTIKLATLSLSRLCCGNNLCRETIPSIPLKVRTDGTPVGGAASYFPASVLVLVTWSSCFASSIEDQP